MLQALRADERTCALPLVAVSASSLQHERRYYLEHGFQDFVGKPYDFGAIHEMLALHAGARLVPAPAEPAADAVPVRPATAPAATGVQAGVRAQLVRLADSAAAGSMTQVRDQLAVLAAGAPALPDGLLAQLEGDLRQYDFATLEARLRDALDRDGALEPRAAGGVLT